MSLRACKGSISIREVLRGQIEIGQNFFCTSQEEDCAKLLASPMIGRCETPAVTK